MTTSAPGTRAAPVRWVSLGKACQLVGVNETTLRRWADAGQLRSYRTPGGHRRFAEEDLRNLLSGRSVGRYQGLGDMTVNRIRRQVHGKEGEEVVSSMAEQARSELRDLGRELLNMIIDTLEHRAHRTRNRETAQKLGTMYGEALKREGFRFSEAVRAFSFFRKNLDETTRHTVRKQGLSADEAMNAYELISSLTDQVLTGIADSYEKARTKRAQA
ncbi:MAG: helix-turn-helix domain-containing protein [Dehalococcoidia bacterium]